MLDSALADKSGLNKKSPQQTKPTPIVASFCVRALLGIWHPPLPLLAGLTVDPSQLVSRLKFSCVFAHHHVSDVCALVLGWESPTQA